MIETVRWHEYEPKAESRRRNGASSGVIKRDAEMPDLGLDDKENELPITPAQCRMARAGVEVSVRELAGLSEASGLTVTRFENGNGSCPAETVLRLKLVLESRGARFLSNPVGLGVMIADH